MENSAVALVQVGKACGTALMDKDDMLAVEEPLEIRIAFNSIDGYQHKNISVTMRTPGNDEELAVGFLFTEGIIKTQQDVKNVQFTSLGENIALVVFASNTIPILQHAERNFYTTSSCGVCGKASIDAIKTLKEFSVGNDNNFIEAGSLYSLQAELEKQQAVFNSTGGLHASALFDRNGQFLLLREDVGRHNALDKLIGAVLLKDIVAFADSVLLLSGRISFELVQKAAMAGIKIIAALGAPSSLAVELAKGCGMTLVGFLRNNSFNIYSGPQRVKF